MQSKRFRTIALTIVIAAFGAAVAAPAYWFQWRSKLDGTRVCAQTSPGSGWEKRPQPFIDAHCTRKPGH